MVAQGVTIERAYLEPEPVRDRSRAVFCPISLGAYVYPDTKWNIVGR